MTVCVNWLGPKTASQRLRQLVMSIYTIKDHGRLGRPRNQ